MEAPETFDLVVVGGGAAGFYGALQVAEMLPGTRIVILEKSGKLLSKVRISGGGRCNVTHACHQSVQLSRHYPRGQRLLKNLFKRYHVTHSVEWFRKNGVELKVEEDGRMFPVSDNSQTIIDCFMKTALAAGVRIRAGEAVTSVDPEGSGFAVTCASGSTYLGRRILIATGGNPSRQFYDWIGKLGHNIIPPIPSLFTFNDSEKRFVDLMGIAVSNAEVRIAGTKFSQQGPVLLTHWGLSGPAIIKLSAWAAEHLFSTGYNFTVSVNWLGPTVNENDVREQFAEFRASRPRQKVMNAPMYGLPQRLWLRLCELSEVDEHRVWSELPRKNLNRLVQFLTGCSFQIRGKTTFKEEFVTCGGVDTAAVDPATLESVSTPGIFFAGEVLNIDGETGGFNFQAAWTTSFVAARAIAESL